MFHTHAGPIISHFWFQETPKALPIITYGSGRVPHAVKQHRISSIRIDTKNLSQCPKVWARSRHRVSILCTLNSLMFNNRVMIMYFLSLLQNTQLVSVKEETIFCTHYYVSGYHVCLAYNNIFVVKRGTIIHVFVEQIIFFKHIQALPRHPVHYLQPHPNPPPTHPNPHPYQVVCPLTVSSIGVVVRIYVTSPACNDAWIC